MGSQEIVVGRDGMLTRRGGRFSELAKRVNREMCMLDMRMQTLGSQRDEGAATAEYAVVLIAACGFGALLIGILKSGTTKSMLEKIVKAALAMAK